MFPFFINSQLINENVQWFQDNMANWSYYSPFLVTTDLQVVPTLTLSMYQNLHLKQEKPLPQTQQDERNKSQEQKVKIEMANEQKSDNQIIIKKITHRKKIAKQYKKKRDTVYYPNTKTNVSEFAQERFLQKNIEYNLLNQIFSYIWTPKKSHSKVLRYFNMSNEKAVVFYEYFRMLKRGIKRIILMSMLTKLCNFQDSHPGFKTISSKKELMSILPLQQFSSAIRFLTNIYLKHYCQLAIMTSKKMRKNILLQHLQKAREIRNQLFGVLEDYKQSQVNQSVSSKLNNYQNQKQ